MTGCASIKITPPQSQELEKSNTYLMSYEKTWIKAVDWFADHNVTIEKIEKPSGLITAKYLITASDEHLDCGNINASGMLEKPHIEKYGSLNVTVREVNSEKSKVNVNFFGEFKLSGNDAWDGRLVIASGHCISTGSLEKSILSYIGS